MLVLFHETPSFSLFLEHFKTFGFDFTSHIFTVSLSFLGLPPFSYLRIDSK